ncbi:PilZ domain-containing protein [Leptospira fletcheri]|uniref:PilZ domain-containing protein n=1 Tax=Leptospira fletcheri TaxID=2484981 RepID=A0A4R9G5R5_9LEPT|nr:PilZ domain-containing protein [Leptospira fletcheri]TGK06515.1 PilZ domain-containing protein [Leptospira fletcheri]
MDLKEQNSREINWIADPAQRFQLVKAYLLNHTVSIKKPPYFFEAIVVESFEKENLLLIHIPTGIKLVKGESISFFKTFAKYLQLDCVFEKEYEEYNYLFRLVNIGITETAREEDRIPVPSEVAFASNLVTYKFFPGDKKEKIPNIVTELFSKYQEKLREGNFPDLHIDKFGFVSNRKLEVVRKTQKILYIRNSADPENFRSKDPSFVDFAKEIVSDIPLAIQTYKNENIKSEVIIPIVYSDGHCEPFPLGVISLHSSEKNILEEEMRELASVANEITDVIKTWNTFRTTTSYKILDISKKGMCVRIQDKKLADLLPKFKTIELDILFRKQRPLPISGEIRWWKKDEKGALILGLEFHKNPEKALETKRLEKNTDILTQQFKKIISKRVS